MKSLAYVLVLCTLCTTATLCSLEMTQPRLESCKNYVTEGVFRKRIEGRNCIEYHPVWRVETLVVQAKTNTPPDAMNRHFKN